MHQYLDSDGSGTSSTCVSSTIGSERLEAATAWLRSNGKVGLVGEYNAPIGGNFWNGLETQVTKRVFGQGGKGFTYRIAYTWSKNTDEDGYRNGWPYQLRQIDHR